MAPDLLIERDAETRALDARLDRLRRDGVGGAVVIEGPAGIGKTALVAWVVDRADQAGVRIVQARSRPISREASFGLLRDWFDLSVRRYGAGQPPFDGPASVLGRLHEAPALTEVGYGLRWALDGLSRDRPVLVVVDDLHWTDEASLQAIELLLGALATMPVLLVGAVRTGEPAAGGDLLDRIVADAERVRPAALSVDGVSAVVAAAPDRPAGLVPADLHRATGGVPFLLRELLLTEHGVPRPVVESVAARLSRLPASATATARAVCVLQDAAEPGPVAELAGHDLAATLDDLRLLVEAQVLTGPAGSPAPGHPLIGDAVLAPLTTAERSGLHLAAAGILSRDETRSADVTVHLLQTLPGDDLDVRERLHAAGRAALTTGVAETAARYLTRACEESPAAPVPVDLLTDTARALAMSGDLTRALSFFSRAAGLLDDPAAHALLLADAGDALTAAGRHEEASGMWRDARAGLDPDAQRGAWQTITARTILSGILIEGVADDIQGEVLRLLAQSPADDTAEDRLILAAAGLGLAIQGLDAGGARALTERAVAGGRLLEEQTADSAVVYLASATLNWTDAYDECIALLDLAVADAQRRGSATAFGTASYCRGHGHMRAGHTRAAIADLEAANSSRSLGWNAYVEIMVGTLCDLYLDRGDRPGVERVRADLARAAQHPTLMMAGFASVSYARLQLADGHHEAALATLDRVVGQLGGGLDTPSTVNWRPLACEAHARAGRADEADRLAAENLAVARGWGAPAAFADALLTRSRHGGDDPRALLEEALAALDHVPAARLRAEVQVELAPLLLDAPDRAVALLREAEAYAVEEGLTPLRDRTADRLYRLGEVPSTTDDLLSRLTPGELTVARLVADGLSNREIGQQLFVTRKTVEFHLSSIYRKLGASSRQQLTAVVRGQHEAARA